MAAMNALDECPPGTAPVAPELMTIPECAARLGISESGAYRLVRKGNFPVPVVKIGALLRVRRAAFERYLAGEG